MHVKELVTNLRCKRECVLKGVAVLVVAAAVVAVDVVVVVAVAVVAVAIQSQDYSDLLHHPTASTKYRPIGD